MKAEKAIIDSELKMEKFPGKGGWTYVVISGVQMEKKNPFGWVQVKGSIDGFPLKQYKLAPMGNGRLFLPVKKEIRKKIGKEAGQTIRVILYHDNSAFEIPLEISECFEQERPELYKTFNAFTDSERKAYVDWIYEAKNLDTRANRILKMMERLGKKMKLYEVKSEKL